MKEVRPTSGRTLLALFNILGNIKGQTFLDLFAGTGRVGAEALKRGASVASVELVRARSLEIKKLLGDKNHIHLNMDIRRALKWLQKKDHTFDIIFADPPYLMDWMTLLPQLLQEHKALLKEHGTIIIERSFREPLALEGTQFELFDEREYGESVLSFLKLKLD